MNILARLLRTDSLWQIQSPTGSTTTIWNSGSERLDHQHVVAIYPGSRVSRVTGWRYWAAQLTRPRLSWVEFLVIVCLVQFIFRIL
jgi:hypothetical protein